MIVKTSGADEQAILIEMDPDCYYSPPYLGPSGWVAIRLDRDDDVDWDRVADRIAISWELVRTATPARGGRAMSRFDEDPTPPELAPEAANDRAVAKAEAAATRRRWLTLAEIVAITGVIIAALTLWNNWQGRKADQESRHEQEASDAQAAKASAAVLLKGTPQHGGSQLSLADPAHSIQSIAVRFPSKLGIDAKDSVLDPRIEADWVSAPLLKMTDGGPDDVEGRLTVLIASDYWDGDTHHSDSAVYDIVWQTEGRMLRGRALKLKGIVLRQRSGASQARIDALWAKEAPQPPSK